MQFRGAQRRADALVTVGRYGHADPRTADQDAGHIFGFDSIAQGMGEHGVIAAFLAVGAVVGDRIAHLFQMGAQGFLEFDTGVVTGHVDGFHDLSLGLLLGSRVAF